MALDFDAMATAIAARYPALTPPAGLVAVRKATGDLPQRMTVLPMVLVFPDAGTLEVGGGTRIGEHVFLARFYFARSKDLAREVNACRRWLSKLIDAHADGMTAGGAVTAVRTVGWRLGRLDFGANTYTGVELRLQVVTSDAWSPTA